MSWKLLKGDIKMPSRDNYTYYLYSNPKYKYQDRCIYVSLCYEEDVNKWDFYINDNYDVIHSMVNSSKSYDSKDDAMKDIEKELKEIPDKLPTMIGLSVREHTNVINYLCKLSKLDGVDAGGFIIN